MMKRIALAVVLAAFPATGFAQTMGALIRDPAGGVMHDPAYQTWYPAPYTIMAPAPHAAMAPYSGGYIVAPARTRDPAGGTIIEDTVLVPDYLWGSQATAYPYGAPAVGTVLTRQSMAYRTQPYGAHGYRYTVVNGHPVVVEPRTRRVVQVIN